MHMTNREMWTAAHGMIFGAAFLLAFAGGFVLLWSLRAEWVTEEGELHNLRMLKLGTWSMALLAWATVIVGTYVVYPWYRAKPPAGTQGAALVEYPKFRWSPSRRRRIGTSSGWSGRSTSRGSRRSWRRSSRSW
jgi:hypothetical protein